MPRLEQRTIKNDILHLERSISEIAAEQGKDSTEYRKGLRTMLQLWAMLKMTRHQEEFLDEVTQFTIEPDTP